MNCLGESAEDRTDHFGTSKSVQKLVGSVGGGQVREHQHVGSPGKWPTGPSLLEQLANDSRVGLHFPIDRDVRSCSLEQLQRLAHPGRLFSSGGPEVRVTDESNAWVTMEVLLRCLGRGYCDLRQLFGSWLDVHSTVSEEVGRRSNNDHVNRRDDRPSFFDFENLEGGPDRLRIVGGEATEDGVGRPLSHHETRIHVRIGHQPLSFMK